MKLMTSHFWNLFFIRLDNKIPARQVIHNAAITIYVRRHLRWLKYYVVGWAAADGQQVLHNTVSTAQGSDRRREDHKGQTSNK